MQKLEELIEVDNGTSACTLPISVIIPARNEAQNLARCLQALAGVGEVFVIDSQSTDETVEIARRYRAKVVQFHYRGGWPKKRQWALDTLPLSYDWVLLLDADEILTTELEREIREAIQTPNVDGYYICLRMHFLRRVLRHGDAGFWKLSLFRRSKGRYECRLRNQDLSMADMEVHEHVVVQGPTARLKTSLIHFNVRSLSHYIQKHDEYSNWEARVWMSGEEDALALQPSLFGNQAQRRRWLKRMFLCVPGCPLLLFIYKYIVCLGFLDGVPGLIYCGFQGIQLFHVKAKLYELKSKMDVQDAPQGETLPHRTT